MSSGAQVMRSGARVMTGIVCVPGAAGMDAVQRCDAEIAASEALLRSGRITDLDEMLGLLQSIQDWGAERRIAIEERVAGCAEMSLENDRKRDAVRSVDGFDNV